MPEPKRPPEITAKPLRDYRSTGQRGEPFWAPGGLWILLGVIAMAALYHFLAGAMTPTIRGWVEALTGI